MNAKRFAAAMQLFGYAIIGALLMPVWVQANPRISPDGLMEAQQAFPIKIAVGACQSQCFEGAVEYNASTLKITKVERYDEAQKAWVDISATANLPKNEPAKTALTQVIQSMTLPGVCPEEGCSCKLPDEKPPFSAWSNISVTSDYIVKSGGKPVDYRAHGTVDYRSRVVQGQCDLNTKTSALFKH